MFAKSLVAMLFSGVLLGCGSGSETKDPARDSPTATRTTPGPQSELIGEWERTTTCEDLVRSLERAGMRKFAAAHVAEEGWVHGVTRADQLKDAQRPCRGAAPRRHSHFFTADRLFGSRDENGDQVDDGTYVLSGNGTVVIYKEFGEVTFRYRIKDDQLFLTPEVPTCAKNNCFAGYWALAVAQPGLPWQRVS